MLQVVAVAVMVRFVSQTPCGSGPYETAPVSVAVRVVTPPFSRFTELVNLKLGSPFRTRFALRTEQFVGVRVIVPLICPVSFRSRLLVICAVTSTVPPPLQLTLVSKQNWFDAPPTQGPAVIVFAAVANPPCISAVIAWT